ncbi:MAG: hypothetical protein H6993_13535 [Pseudomonadales bacterium]|nr:hypothetical protein [Pseudomonadales bacterium]
MPRLTLPGQALTLLLLLAGALTVQAEPIQADFHGRRLNAAFIETGTDREEAVLVVHDIWAHQDMALIRDVQAGLAARGLSSLAPTLSLGIDDRRGRLACADGMQPDERLVPAEIGFWVDWLARRGYRTLTLLGHSHGAARVVAYVVEQQPRLVTRLILLAPRTWQPGDIRAARDENASVPFATLLRQAKAHPDALLGPARLPGCDGVHIPGHVFSAYNDPAAVPHVPTLLARIHIRTDVVLAAQDTPAPWRPEEIASARQHLNVRVHRATGTDQVLRSPYLAHALDTVLAPQANLSTVASDKVQLLFLALSDCTVCLRMEREVFHPLLRSGALLKRAQITHLLLDDPRTLIGFDGQYVTADALAERYAARVTPTLLFLDARGEPLQPPIVGYTSPDSVAARIEQALDRARGTLSP